MRFLRVVIVLLFATQFAFNVARAGSVKTQAAVLSAEYNVQTEKLTLEVLYRGTKVDDSKFNVEVGAFTEPGPGGTPKAKAQVFYIRQGLTTPMLTISKISFEAKQIVNSSGSQVSIVGTKLLFVNTNPLIALNPATVTPRVEVSVPKKNPIDGDVDGDTKAERAQFICKEIVEEASSELGPISVIVTQLSGQKLATKPEKFRLEMFRDRLKKPFLSVAGAGAFDDQQPDLFNFESDNASVSLTVDLAQSDSDEVKMAKAGARRPTTTKLNCR
jgi:hypothetical protein